MLNFIDNKKINKLKSHYKIFKPIHITDPKITSSTRYNRLVFLIALLIFIIESF